MPSVCPYFKKGICRFGNRCWNSHDLSSSSVDNKGREENVVQFFDTNTTDTDTTESQQEYRDFDTTRDSSLKIKSETLTSTNMPSEETTKDNEKYVISELFKKLSLAEKEINSLNQKLQDSYGKENLSWTKHNDFQLNDSYLHCTICYELFIKPTVLNCSHTFCQWCIDTWSSVNHDCPICRKNVVNKSYCLDLDHYIKKMVELGPTEIKNSYKLLEEKRNSEGPKDIRLDIDDEDDDWLIENQANPFHGYYSI